MPKLSSQDTAFYPVLRMENGLHFMARVIKKKTANKTESKNSFAFKAGALTVRTFFLKCFPFNVT